MTVDERRAARREALARVAAGHRPLVAIFADLRGELADPPPIEAEPAGDAPAASRGGQVAALEQSLRMTLEAIRERAAGGGPDEVAPGDPQDIALWFAVDAEPVLVELADTGARRLTAERSLGAVPDVGDAGVDAAAIALAALAGDVVQASGGERTDGFDVVSREVLPAAAARLTAVAVNAGYAAAARAAGLRPHQRFGEPYCPAASCYGQDHRLLDEFVIAAAGVPPYADDCNCTIVLD
ncbi:MAG TPA: hypothetical protein VNB94_00605 [Mycobacteriales bacterium]|nr:hypothetical protein [Mycobacteriales bacterium]